MVTGASGFLGGPICAALVNRGLKVRGLIRRADADLPGQVEKVVVADLLDRNALAVALRGGSAVVHLAARVHLMRDSAPDPLAEFRRVNVEGTKAVLETAVAAGVRAFVFVSSVKAVGESSEVPWTRSTPAKPVDPYGVSKREAELLVAGLAKEYGMRAPILRLPLVYGPGMRANMLQLFRLVDRGWPLPVGGISNRRSLVFVGNVAAAIETALTSGRANGGPWFITDGEDLTTPELVRAIALGLGRPARIFAMPGVLLTTAARVGDVLARLIPFPLTSAAVRRLTESLVVDGGEFWAATGFRPPFTIRQGLGLTAEWYRTRYEKGEWPAS